MSRSEYFRQQLLESKETVVDIDFIGAPVLALYIQWLLKGRYYEHTGFARAPSYRTACNTHTLDNIDNPQVADTIAGVVVWCVKAGILAWKLGHRLESPKFQNYAMKRLFAAYTRERPSFQIDGDFLAWTRDSGTALREFFEDLVIRNWGDESLIDSEHASWARFIKDNDNFLGEFIKAVAIPLRKRVAEPMEVEKYLLREE